MYSCVRFRATLENGQTVDGPIQGNGGYIGNGALHAGYDTAALHSLRRMQQYQRMAADGRHQAIYEPSPGHVAMFPEDCAESRGEAVHVPLLGTRFELAL